MNTPKEQKTRTKARKSPAPSTRKDFFKELCWKYYCKGYTQVQVQAQVKKETGKMLDIRTVAGYLKEALDKCKVEKPDLAKDVTVLELQKINIMEVEYWEGYERSRKPTKTIKQKFLPEEVPEFEKKEGRGRKKQVGTVNKLKLIEEVHETKEQTGDIKFLLGVQWCVEQRLLILGHSASDKPKVEKPAKPLSEEEKELIEAGNQITGGTRRRIRLTVNQESAGGGV